MRELHLFAGIGGGVLGGLLLGHRPVGAIEIDAYCRSVLLERQRDGSLPAFPIHDDVRTFDGTAWRGKVDVVCGGFPCQPWSTAGKRLGTADERHLWPEMARIVAECRPRFVFAENVSLAAFEQPWRDLRGLGYRVPPALRLGGCQLGAMYHRHRWWLLAADADLEPWSQQRREAGTAIPPADADGGGRQNLQAPVSARQSDAARSDPADADQHREPDQPQHAELASAPDARHPDSTRPPQRQGQPADPRPQRTPPLGAAWRAPAPRLLRLVSGAARRVVKRRQRIHALGNAQVPQVAAAAFQILMQRLA